MLLLAWVSASVADAVEPAVPVPTVPVPTALEAEIRRHRTTGTVEIVGGAAATAGGFVVLLVGRGKPGELSKEAQWVADVRSVGGAVLVIGGLTSMLLGGAEIGKAKALSEQAPAVALQPVVGRDGAGLCLTVTR